MSDELFRRIDAAIDRIIAGHSPQRIPADLTDPDIVLTDCRRALEAERAAHQETKRELVSETLRLLDRAEKAERERDEAVENQQRQWLEKDHYRDRALAADVAAVALRSERDEARAELAALKKAVTDQLHFDMKAILSDTPENRLRARVAQLEEALEWARKALDNAEEAGLLGDNADPDRTGDAAIEFDQNIAPIRAALSTSPSDWLAEHDRSIAERQREACAARVRPLDADPDLSYTSAEILATPLVTK